jgi:FtsP/CotA-like multicopper oxidase with cupredoxin domain
MCVNGVRTPRLEVATHKYQFRVLNGSDHRIYRLSLHLIDPERNDDTQRIPFTIVASDGGLLPTAVERTELVVAPAERYAIVVDFSNVPLGSTLELRNGGPDATLPPVFATGVLSVQLPDVMWFNVTRSEPDSSVVPNELLPIERLDPAQAVVTRQLALGGQDSQDTNQAGNWFINEKQFDPTRIDFEAKLGTIEIWEIVSLTAANHVVHLHLNQFQVLDDGAGASPPPEQLGWKDTLLIRPFTTVRIIVKWDGFTGIYVFHCHVVGHEDTGMMAQVRVSE